jgi:hypothetical protein
LNELKKQKKIVLRGKGRGAVWNKAKRMNRNILILGATSAIGRAIAMSFAEKGDRRG